MSVATRGLRSDQHAYQHCFIGHSQGASWRKTFEEVCEEVLPQFGLKPWYADKHFQGSVPLREKVVNMIATTRYGIYDLSSWRENDRSPWIMPRNVLIELGMAIALNRPILLLRHARNRECGLAVSACLEGIEIGEFGDGKKQLKQTLHTRLPLLTQRTPRQDWLNRYCQFGCLECSYREAHPQAQQWGRQKIHIHISDGANATHIDCSDFHDMIEEEVINRFHNLEFNYLDRLTSPQGSKFLLCARCQEVRSSPFAIYRITPHTSADTFIAIGISIALEKQFNYPITKILITDNANTIPSLLKGYEIIVEQNYAGIKDRLISILPGLIEEAKQTTWKPKPLPFEVFLPEKDMPATKAVAEQKEEISITDANPRASSEEKLDDVPLASEESIIATTNESSIVQSAHLVLLSQTGEVLREYLLDKEEITIGRAPNVDIILNKDKLPSRRHATVRYENGKYMIRDERSANGTFVNGQQIEDMVPHVLRNNDHIGIGEHELVFRTSTSVAVNVNKEPAKNKPVSIFISYAPEDRRYMDRLRTHLSLLRRANLIDRIWSIGDIEPGMNVAREIDRHLNTADLILLLISDDFLNSDFYVGKKMDRIMEKHDRGEATVIPILLRPTYWGETKFQALPTNEEPISTWDNQDRAFVDVVEGIRRVIEDLQNRS